MFLFFSRLFFCGVLAEDLHGTQSNLVFHRAANHGYVDFEPSLNHRFLQLIPCQFFPLLFAGFLCGASEISARQKKTSTNTVPLRKAKTDRTSKTIFIRWETGITGIEYDLLANKLMEEIRTWVLSFLGRVQRKVSLARGQEIHALSAMFRSM